MICFHKLNVVLTTAKTKNKHIIELQLLFFFLI